MLRSSYGSCLIFRVFPEAAIIVPFLEPELDIIEAAMRHAAAVGSRCLFVQKPIRFTSLS